MIRACDIYDVLGLPRGLRLHHARTVALLQLISRSTDGTTAEAAREAELAMSVHDVGNLVKMPESDQLALRMLQESEESLERWRLATRVARARYGSDDHIATQTMLSELGIRDDLRKLVARKSSKNLPSVISRKIGVELLALYADMRVGPFGVVTIEERHHEASARYRGTPRQGLGGTVTLEELLRLETLVSRLVGSSVAVIRDDAVESLVSDCLELELDGAFES